MSLILEALRKSEAERRRGDAPDLHAELAPLPVATARPRMAAGTALAVVAAFLVCAGVIAWAWRPASQVDSTTSVATPAPPVRPGSGMRAAPGTIADGAPRLPRVERLRPPSAGAPPVDASTLPAAVANAGAGTGPDLAPTRVPASATADAGTAMPATAPTAATGTPTPAAETAPSVTTPAPSPAPAAVAVEPAAPGGADLPKVSELDADARRQLPAMKLTLHMWNADPGRRFIILDGVRHVEGDRIGSGRITAIDGDGVVIDLGGRAVRLPLR